MPCLDVKKKEKKHYDMIEQNVKDPWRKIKRTKIVVVVIVVRVTATMRKKVEET